MTTNKDAVPSDAFEDWASEEGINNFHFNHCWAAWQASWRAAIKQAHSVCLAGVKWSPEPSKHIQFYVNGTCHRLAAEISTLASQPPQTEQTLKCVLCGGCGPVVGCDACQGTGNIAMQPAIGTEGDPAC